jgi:hypothetical protein
VAPSRARRRGTFGAFRRPFITDPVFWIAAAMATAIGVLVSGTLIAFGGRMPDSVLSWGVAALFFVIAGWLSFKLLAMGLNTSKALEEAQVADPKRAASLENKGRSAGAVAGRGAAALMRRGRKRSTGTSSGTTDATPEPAPRATPTPAPAPDPGVPTATPTAASATEATPEVTVDKAARVFGSMVGRRLAERRKDD